jgi:hypothetical protein
LKAGLNRLCAASVRRFNLMIKNYIEALNKSHFDPRILDDVIKENQLDAICD